MFYLLIFIIIFQLCLNSTYFHKHQQEIAFSMEEDDKMALSPREDLCILAAVHNNPQSTWQTISIYIVQAYNQFIPSDVCEDRYQSFLRFIEPIRQVKQYLPYKLKNAEAQEKQKRPQNFVFHYMELKNKMKKNLNKTISQLQNFQKKIIAKSFVSQIRSKTKKIYKDNCDKQEKINKFIDLIYKQIKQRSSCKSTLTQSVIGQRIQQIFFQIVEKVNEVLENNDHNKIQNPFNVIKLFNPNSLIDEKRQIFQLYYSEQHLSIQSAILIKDKLNYVLTLFGYQNISHHQYPLELSKTYDHIDFSIQLQEHQMLNQCMQQASVPQSSNHSEETAKKFLQKKDVEYDDQSMLQLLQPSNIDHFDQIYSSIQPINSFIPPSNPQNHQFVYRQEDNKCKFSYQSMQITVTNSVVKIVQQNPSQETEQIKRQAKIQQVKYEQCENDKKDKTKKYRMIKKGKAVPKLPSYTKTIIVLND